MSRLPRALVALALLAGCGRGELALDLAPRFAALLEVPGLMGVVRVTRAGDGAVVAQSTMVAFEGTARARLPGVPAGVDLRVEVEWSSGAVVVARSREPQAVRLEEGQTAQVAFDADDLVYPDTDGDGAADLAEVVWEAQNPAQAAGAHQDAARMPPGFLTGLEGSEALPGYPFGVALLGESGVAVLPLLTQVSIQGIPEGSQRLSLQSLVTGAHFEYPLDCDGTGVPWATVANPSVNPVQILAVCGSQLSIFQGEFELEFATRTSLTLPSESMFLSVAKDGGVAYAAHPSFGAISVIGLRPGQPGFALIVDRLQSPLLPQGCVPKVLADTGERLIVADGSGGLVAVAHQGNAGHSLQGRALADSLRNPGWVVAHPAGQVVFSSDDVSNELVAVDVASPDPAAWHELGRLPLDSAVSAAELAPGPGAWLYVVTERSIYCVEAFSLAVAWRVTLGAPDVLSLGGLALSPDGLHGASSSPDGRALLRLGRPPAASRELEPNGATRAGPHAHNALGPPPSAAVGLADKDEAEPGTPLMLPCQVQTLQGLQDFHDDVEDVWRFEPGDFSGPLALAVRPSSCYARLNLSTFDEGGQLLEHAYHPVEPYCLSNGTGVWMLVQDPSQVAWVGVGAQDFDFNSNAAHYTLEAIPQPGLREIDELEPNTELGSAQILTWLPVIVRGRAELTDDRGPVVSGVDTAEDCFLLDFSRGRLAIRLDMAAGVELNLYVLDATGARLQGQVGMTGAGLSEYFIAEPHSQSPAYGLVCVSIPALADPPQADYTLTIVDLAR